MARHRWTLLTIVALAVTACSPSDEVVSTTDDPAADAATTVETTSTTVASTTTVPAPTTDDSTTVAPTTTVEPTTTTTAAPTTTAPATSTTVPGPAPTPPAVAYAVGDSDLVEIDVADGSVTRTVSELFEGDGVFRGGLRLAPDGATLWYSEGYEDGWFGCESSVGSIGRVDVASGAATTFAAGSGVEVAPDGSRIAYLASDLCLPDPENPADWVLTPYDRVVVADPVAGTEQVVVTEPAPDAGDAPTAVTWAGFAPNGELLVLTAAGRLRRVDLAGPAVLQEHPVVLEEVRGIPVGTTEGALITVDAGDEGSADVFAIDLASGGASLLASSEGFVTVGVAANGAIVVAGFTAVDVEPGAPVTVLTAPDGATFYDVDW